MRVPVPRAMKEGRTARMSDMGTLTLSSWTRHQRSRDFSVGKAVMRTMPALLMRMSIGPRAETAWLMMSLAGVVRSSADMLMAGTWYVVLISVMRRSRSDWERATAATKRKGLVV